MLKDLFVTNRTCRTFDESRAVTREELLGFVECARLAPSTANIQPLCYRLVCTPEECALIQPLTKWGGALPELHLPPEGHRPTAFVIICQDTEKFGPADKFRIDVGICAMAMDLAAAEAGLACCIIQSFRKEELSAALGLPENVAPLLVVAFGKPDEIRKTVGTGEDGSTRYYRDADGVHCVPKRSIEEIVL